ncbi:MAG: 50S ribosomal protein L28 [Candidatus Levybacteria bacterium]|nr:50S ribosomal protein L28 [Candidatus Levybacteria bacterium]
MAMKCVLCGKGRMVGRQHTHHPGVAGGRWKKRAPKTQKIFKPNLHWARVTISGVTKRVRLCTKCLRKVKGFKSPTPAAIVFQTDQ